MKWLLVLFFPLFLVGLPYEYSLDSEGHLSEVFTCDGSCRYAYFYSPEGHLIRAEDRIGGASCTRTYDDAGRLTSETFCDAFSLSYIYDALGRRTRMELPDGSAVVYRYEEDRLHEIVRLDSGGKERYAHSFLAYGPQRQPLREQMIGAAGILEREYDEKWRASALISPLGKEAVASRDARGNILKMEDGRTFTYDEKSALLEESDHSYTYDARGNRASKDGSAYEVDGEDKLLSSYAYDVQGNAMAKDTLRFIYDPFGRLIETISPGEWRIVYGYDGFHRRLIETIFSWIANEWKETDRRYFLYDHQYEVGTVDSSAVLHECRILGLRHNGDWGSAIALELEGEPFAPIHDLLGNVVALLFASNGAVAQRYRYTAFGEEESSEEPLSPWRYASKRTDARTRLVFFGRRYYDSETGRYLTPDPLGTADGDNLYAFVHNNPISFTDLFGLESVLTQIASWIGTAIQQYCYHATPFPGIRNLGIYIGELLGATPISTEDYTSLVGSVGGINHNDKHVCVWLNGINTNFRDTVSIANDVSDACGGLKVYYAYCSTHGFMADAWDLIADKLHFHTAVSDIALEALKKAIDDVGGVDGGGKVTVFAHSHGARIFEKASAPLTDAEKGMLEVYTLGPAALFPVGSFASVQHSLSDKDYFSACSDPLRFLYNYIWHPELFHFSTGSNGAVFENHAIQGPIYQQEILRIGSLIQKQDSGL